MPKKLELRRKTFETMVKVIEEQKAKVMEAFDKVELGIADYKVYNGIQKSISKISKEVENAAINNKKVSPEMLRNWEKVVNDAKEACESKREKFYSAESTRLIHIDLMWALDAMSDRIHEYQKSVDSTNGITGCSVSRIEAEKQKLMKEFDEKMRKRELALAAARERAKILEAKRLAELKEKEAAEKKALDLENSKKSLKELEGSLADTNKKLFTKQSNQFSDFRKCVVALNKALAKKNAFDNPKNMEKLAKLIIAVKGAEKRYGTHCLKHSKTNLTRQNRVNYVGQVLDQVHALERTFPNIVDIEKNMIAKAKDADAFEKSCIVDATIPKKNIQFLDEMIWASK